MELYVFDNYDEISRYAAKMVSDFINENSNCVLGLATGSTPLGMYKKLIEYNRDRIVNFSEVKTFNLDEYRGLSGEHPQSYRYFMNKNFFDHVNIDKNNTFIPNGTCEDVAKECRDYEEKINELGGIDLQILGVGSNGHIGFNEPSSELYAYTHLADLTEDTIKANSRFFKNIEEVPSKAITMGVGQIMKSKRIILLASGVNKAKVIGRIFNGKISTENPSSILQLHPSVAVIADKKAASLI
ncbi:glucosamine-6-phosphate deaminase [Clostridium pasteurianum DSM 525 = ATCC 6013]|uniref:Glucosamine-6-phosphate deaminase n=1 Tax=Clostridium pasteurianum DSM 525 = ATCC 6013 TaxID=1262449 RepID=A0A0H3IY62_CLOPA|nr:glucosamine-6-phosphate deaminase [Clostridium pasteurianum]AJA46441.1 glucosamine-6-phosphate deaminase [Clostridium pasteurianum DSM 525 = ATCC 6013]AJA50429.1 glucosamine-6-phosphate deaminase [Clostridium pasteurianum DSM 525 = ATCC 6013]AOZ73875.1 glucosamine-6-phosphate deaminase [Clostridium pasteurianum DSM 525 = ATCC 6013]AOZ77672.1 glucosamine-6-phosphate deaminase [Clostridium pasteurianum]ELP61016.1 glucosamine-6-phosphate isomerase [Clostridium pasteurianum DSM 525 = ATCC 6013]